MVRDPNLRDKPLGIQQKNMVVTCNYVARGFGVGKLELVSEAKKKCPGLVCGATMRLLHSRLLTSRF
jgi:DNA polymerase iota